MAGRIAGHLFPRAAAARAALLAAVLLGAPALPSAPAHAAETPRWSVSPAAAEDGGADRTAGRTGEGAAGDGGAGGGGRPWFYLEGPPGGVLQDTVSVTNPTKEPLVLRLRGADAAGGEDGRFTVGGADEERRGLGAWLVLAEERVTVPARTRADIPFTVTVPEGASPGDHPGAIVVRSGARSVETRVYLRVAGPVLSALTVDDVAVGHGEPVLPGAGTATAVIHYTLVNRGNVAVRPRVAVRAEGLFGRELLDRPARGVPDELLPGQRVEVSEEWSGAPRLDRVRVTVTAGGTGPRRSGTASFTAVPWLPVGLLLTGLAAPAAWLAHRRGLWPRRKEAGTGGAAPAAAGDEDAGAPQGSPV